MKRRPLQAYARAPADCGETGSRNGRVSKKAPNEPKKVRKDFRRENGSTQGGFLPRKVAFCSFYVSDSEPSPGAAVLSAPTSLSMAATATCMASQSK